MKYKKEVVRSLALVTQLGIQVMVPVFLCLILGIWADKKFNTSITLLMLIIGMAAGVRNAYLLVKGVLAENERDNK